MHCSAASCSPLRSAGGNTTLLYDEHQNTFATSDPLPLPEGVAQTYNSIAVLFRKP